MRFSCTSNIYALYIIKLSKWLMLIMPIVALYYKENGLDEYDIYLLQAIYSLSVAFMEIPSGYMADVIGRKKSLVAGAILGTLGFAIYAFSTGFYSFLAAEIILGLGGSFISGSDSALLYDSLAADNEHHKFLQYEGRITSLGNFAETIAAVCGGLIAAFVSYRGVYVCQTVIAGLAIPASLMLVEPDRVKLSDRIGLRQILSICRQAIISDKKLSSTIFLSSVTGTATLCMAWTSQVFFLQQGFDEKAITPLWVGLNLTVAVIAAIAHKTRTALGYKNSLIIIIVYIPLGYILLGLMPMALGIVSLFIFYGVRGYATPVLKDLTNQFCTSDVRATVLSIRSLIIRTSFSILGPFIGFISFRTSFSTALVTAGSILLVLSISAGIFLFVAAPETTRPPEVQD